MKKDADAEADVYNHLANFFARYYRDGDFVSQRRYRAAAGPPVSSPTMARK